MDSLIQEYRETLTQNLNKIDEDYKIFNKNILKRLKDEEKMYLKLITEKNEKISELETKTETLQNNYDELENKFNKLQENCNEFEKVSILKNLNNQLHEKNIESEILNKKLKKYEETIKNLRDKYENDAEEEEEDGDDDGDGDGEEEEQENGDDDGDGDGEEEDGEDEEEDEEEEDGEDEEEEDEDAEEEEEIEVDFIEKKLKCPKTKKMKLFYITDDINKDIYEIAEDEEIGDHVGKMVKNKPYFFK